MRFLLVFLVAFCSLGAAAAAAQPVDGYFIARRACGATQSVRGADPVAAATLEVDRAYRVVAENKQPATHYQIEVSGASPSRRWVDRACGERVAPTTGSAATPAPADDASSEPVREAVAPTSPMPDADRSTSTRNILAISWQPAFCEGQPNRPECRTQAGGRADASRFSLHGVWPQPRDRQYCGASAGFSDEYFRESLALLDRVNASPVGALFAGRVGRTVTTEEIRAAFDQAFGPGSGERVRVSCRDDGGRRLVDELTIGLVGQVAAEPDLAALIRAARPTRAGCPGGVVDAAGAQ